MVNNKKNYLEYGWVQVKNVIPEETLEFYRSQVSDVIRMVARSKNLDLDPGIDVREQFNALCRYDRFYGGLVYDCLRYHPLMQNISNEKKLIDICNSLIDPELLFHVHDQIQFRIDRRSEERFQLEWHQDYWYNNTSTKAITAWIPLFDVNLESGPMQIINGSHLLGPRKVIIDPNYKSDWDQNRLIRAAEPIDFESGSALACPAGSVVFLNALTLHRSGSNFTDYPRFTIILRYADLYDDELISKRWKAGISPGQVSLLEQRPDLVVNMDQLTTGSELSERN